MSREVPDYFEPLLAYRVWSVAGDRLLSRGNTAWTPYEALEGRHVDGGLGAFDSPNACHGTPCDGHIPNYAPKCGIYGFKRPDDLRSQVDATYGDEIVGAVWLWGRIAEHERGYRAQFAYPAHFIYGYCCDAAVIAAAYGVPYQEDLSWKSAYQFGGSWQSHYGFLSLNNRVWFTPSASKIRFTPIRSWSSPYLSHPDEHEFIKKPKPKHIYQQPSFHIHKPIGWYNDKSRNLWLRVAAS